MTGFRDFVRYRLECARRGVRGGSICEWRISFDKHGFLIHKTTFHFRAPTLASTHVLWSQVQRIVAWKEDNFTWDTLWLEFQLEDGSEVCVPEEAIGWRDLLRLLPEHISGMPKQEDWWLGVVQPAFAPNVTQLYPMPT